MFKFPKFFALGGLGYPVDLVAEVNNDSTLNGMAYLDKHRVEVLKTLDPDRKGQVFCHELTHSILGAMGETELNANEKFVDLFGTFLYQAWKTMTPMGGKGGDE